jgi:hypothetical protein
VRWRAVLIWTALSLVAWFILAAVVGLLVGTVLQQALNPYEVPLRQAGLMVPIAISLGLLPRLAVGLLLATAFWATMAKRFALLEGTEHRSVRYFALYSMAVGTLAWLGFPLRPPFDAYGALLFVASLVLPRFLTRRLSFGAFAT